MHDALLQPTSFMREPTYAIDVRSVRCLADLFVELFWFCVQVCVYWCRRTRQEQAGKHVETQPQPSSSGGLCLPQFSPRHSSPPPAFNGSSMPMAVPVPSWFPSLYHSLPQLTTHLPLAFLLACLVKVEDQTYDHQDNAALLLNWKTGTPVRVCRQVSASPLLYTYEGLYKVIDHKREESSDGPKVGPLGGSNLPFFFLNLERKKNKGRVRGVCCTAAVEHGRRREPHALLPRPPSARSAARLCCQHTRNLCASARISHVSARRALLGQARLVVPQRCTSSGCAPFLIHVASNRLSHTSDVPNLRLSECLASRCGLCCLSCTAGDPVHNAGCAWALCCQWKGRVQGTLTRQGVPEAAACRSRSRGQTEGQQSAVGHSGKRIFPLLIRP